MTDTVGSGRVTGRLTASVTAVVCMLAVAVTSCGMDDGGGSQATDGPSTSQVHASGLDVEGVVRATVTAGPTRFTMEVVADHAEAVLLRTEGTVDWESLTGHRVEWVDAAYSGGRAPSGELMELGQTWLVDGRLASLAANGTALRPAAGGIGNFVGFDDMSEHVDAASALRAVLEGRTWSPSPDGSFTTTDERRAYVVEPDDEGRLTRWEQHDPSVSLASVVRLSDFGVAPGDLAPPHFSDGPRLGA